MEKHKLLYPPVPVSNEKDLVALISYTKSTFLFLIIDMKTEKYVENGILKLSALFDQFPHRCRLKSIIFNVLDYDASNVCEFRQMIHQKCQDEKIPYLFINEFIHRNTMLLMNAKREIKSGETVLNVHIVGKEGNLDVVELDRKSTHFVMKNRRKVVNIPGVSETKMKAEILGSSTPKWILASIANGSFFPENAKRVKMLKNNILKSKKLVAFENIFTADVPRHLIALSMPMFDSSFNNISIAPFCDGFYAVMNRLDGQANFEDALACTELYESLPFEKSWILPKSIEPYYVAFFHDKSSQCLGTLTEGLLNGYCHRVKLTLIVDSNNCPFLYQDTVMSGDIKSFPDKLDSKEALNMPVIGLLDNSSVICLHDENGYDFIESWNGECGKDFYLCFDQQKPRLITDILVHDNEKSKSSSMVYDLLKIMSKSPEKIEGEPRWKFAVIKDVNQLILLEFDTFDDTRKAASPSFLMALVLKDHIKAIKKETGKLPKQLGFYLFNDFSKKERSNVLKGLHEACKLLKIGFHLVNC